MTPAPPPELHRLLEMLGHQVGMTEQVQRDVRRVMVALVLVVVVMGAGVTVSLLLVKSQVDDVRGVQVAVAAAAAEAGLLASQNRDVLRQQCLELEKLKIPIRRVLRESGAERFLGLFEAKVCEATS